MQSKISATLTSPDDLPTITQSYPGWLWDAANNQQLVNLGSYMKNKTIGYSTSQKLDQAMLASAQINDTQYGIPFNKSTEVLYYNKELLAKYDVKVPQNLAEFKEAAKTIYQKSKGKVVGGGFDTLTNYYQSSMKDLGVDTFSPKLNFTSKKSKKVINYYLNGIKAGYFQTKGSETSLSTAFDNQQLAMYVGSSSGEVYVKADSADKFTYEVTTTPQKSTVIQGTDIYMFKAANATERTAGYEYIKYLTSAKSTLTWAEATGYLPVVDRVMSDDDYLNSDSKVAKVSQKATKNLISTPIKANLEPVSTALDTALTSLLDNPKDDTNKLIKQGAKDIKNSWTN